MSIAKIQRVNGQVNGWSKGEKSTKANVMRQLVYSTRESYKTSISYLSNVLFDDSFKKFFSMR